VKAVLDENEYQKGKEVSEEEIALVNIQGDSFHPEWNDQPSSLLNKMFMLFFDSS